MPAKSGIVPPLYHLKDVTRHNLSINVNGNSNGISRRKSIKSLRITDPQQVASYLQDTSASSSAIGIGNVGSWTDDLGEGKALRASIVQQASEPIVEPKDEWDMSLDVGKKKKIGRKRDPWKEFDRSQPSVFQTEQGMRRKNTDLSTVNNIKSDDFKFQKKKKPKRKKKGGKRNQHNQARQKRMNSCEA